MTRQIEPKLLAVVLTALLTALALPALAGAAVKVTVLAAATADEDPTIGTLPCP